MASEDIDLPPPVYSEVDAEEDEQAPISVRKLSKRDDHTSGLKMTTLDIAQHSRALGETGDAASDIDDADFEDETLLERLIGLTEMFPESVRRRVSSTFYFIISGVKSSYGISRSVSWFLASTATLCFLPLFLELERVQTEEQEAVHQRTMMLGPRAAAGGSSLAGFSAAVPHLTPMDSK